VIPLFTVADQVVDPNCGLSFQVVTTLIVIVIGVGIAVLLRDAFTSHSVVIDAFETPAALADRGVTGTVLAKRDPLSVGSRQFEKDCALRLTDDHLAELNYGCLIRVIRNISHDLLRVGSKRSLEFFC
jgi:hypothetical protein